MASKVALWCWSPSDCKEIQPVHYKGDQPWVLFGRNDAKAETPVLWPPHAKSWLIGKDSDAGREWGQEEKGKTEDEMAGWHHQLDGHEFEWTPIDGEGQGGLACCDSWGGKESDTTEQLNWSDNWIAFPGLPRWLSGKYATQPRDTASIPGPGSPHASEQLSPCTTTTEPVLKSLGATATEPTCRNYENPCAGSPCSTTREATAMRSPHHRT